MVVYERFQLQGLNWRSFGVLDWIPVNVVLLFTLSPLGKKELKITNKQTNKNLYLLRRQLPRLQTVSWIVHS